MRRWNDRIKSALKRGKFTARDKILINSWPSCAVGEFLEGREGMPPKTDRWGSTWLQFIRSQKEGRDLELLGMKLYTNVRYDRTEEALVDYEAIQTLKKGHHEPQEQPV